VGFPSANKPQFALVKKNQRKHYFMFEKNVGAMTFKNIDTIPCTHGEGFPIENPT
jgi:hypothetical protein